MKHILSKHELKQIAGAAVVIAVAAAMGAALLPYGVRLSLVRLPDTAIDTTLRAELAVGDSYWHGVDLFVGTTQNALDASADAYIAGITAFVDGTYAARDLSAAAYGGVATAYLNGITSIHSSQVRTMLGMSASMQDGMSNVAAGYSAVAAWYAQSDARIHERLGR